MQTSLARGLRILDLLARSRGPLAFKDICRRLDDVSRASLCRLLGGLVRAGYVHKERGGYGPGYRLAVFAGLKTEGRDGYLRSLYLPVMRRVTSRFHVTTVLAERVGDVLVGIHRHQLDDTVHMQDVGYVNDQLDQPWMMLVAAFEPRVRALYTRAVDLARIDDCRRRGFIFSDVGKLSIRRLCFPLFDQEGELAGALGVGGTPLQITPGNRDRIAHHVRRSLAAADNGGGPAARTARRRRAAEIAGGSA